MNHPRPAPSGPAAPDVAATTADTTGSELGARLHRALGRLDIILLTIAAVIGIDSIAQIATSGGAEAFTWVAIIVVTFLLPYCRFRDKLAISGFLGQRVSDFRLTCQTGRMILWADARCSSGTAPSPATRSRRRGRKHVPI